jgi:probable rRNA maturation factor
VETFLNEQKIKSEVEVSISIVGDRKMRELNKKYRNLEETTSVLSFSQQEGKPFINPPDGILRLGDIIISYPQTVAMAAAENKLIDQKISELVRHGLANLLGIP